jgi:serine/threonine protein kinase
VPTAAPAVIDGADMVAMAAKLGSAMAFLESQSIVHRDIAARNVLVGNGPREVKMADLGAARNVHRTSEASYRGVYTATTDHAPARWMALEALQQAKFSHKSDVFAFGVLLWEMLSFGQTPWGAFGVFDFTQALQNGERLPLPPTSEADSEGAEVHPATNALYALALRCWKEAPTKRPHFRQLEAELATHRTVLATTAPNTAPSTKRGSEGPAQIRVVNGNAVEGQRPVLDASGYVVDTWPTRRPALDADGYVAANTVHNAANTVHNAASGIALLNHPAPAGDNVDGCHGGGVTDGVRHGEGLASCDFARRSVAGSASAHDEPDLPAKREIDSSNLQQRGEVADGTLRRPSLFLGMGQRSASGGGGGGNDGGGGVNPDETRL